MKNTRSFLAGMLCGGIVVYLIWLYFSSFLWSSFVITAPAHQTATAVGALGVAPSTLYEAPPAQENALPSVQDERVDAVPLQQTLPEVKNIERGAIAQSIPERTAYVEATEFPEVVAYNGGTASSVSDVAPIRTAVAPQSEAPSSQSVLTSLAYGQGLGGGGGGASSSVPVVADVVCTLPQVRDAATNTCVTPEVVCTLPQVRDAATNTCVTPDVVCTLPQVRDAATNTCVVPPVVCTSPEVRDATTNTCMLPQRTGPTELPDRFLADTTLTYVLSPYVSKAAGAQTVTIPAGVTVTVEEGALLKLAAETKIIVEGTLRILGTATRPVVVTSLYDDTVLPVTNTNAALTPTAKPWSNIDVRAGGTLTASYTTFAYGGWNALSSNATILANGSVTLADSRITTSDSAALRYGGTLLDTTRLIVDGARLGVVLSAAAYQMVDTAITHVADKAVSLANVIGKITGTTGSANGTNGIVLISVSLALGQTGHLYPNAIAYYTDVNHSIAGTLVIHKGVFVQQADTKYTVSGAITTDASESGDAPVFTSLWDNAHRGESRGTVFPNADRAPAQGDWYGFEVQGGGSVDAGITKKYAAHP